MKKAAQKLLDLEQKCFIKGGHTNSKDVIDLFFK